MKRLIVDDSSIDHQNVANALASEIWQQNRDHQIDCVAFLADDIDLCFISGFQAEKTRELEIEPYNFVFVQLSVIKSGDRDTYGRVLLEDGNWELIEKMTRSILGKFQSLIRKVAKTYATTALPEFSADSIGFYFTKNGHLSTVGDLEFIGGDDVLARRAPSPSGIEELREFALAFDYSPAKLFEADNGRVKVVNLTRSGRKISDRFLRKWKELRNILEYHKPELVRILSDPTVRHVVTQSQISAIMAEVPFAKLEVVDYETANKIEEDHCTRHLRNKLRWLDGKL